MMNRYRRGDAMVRHQLAWVAAGGVFWAASLAPFVVVRYLTPVSDDVGSAFTALAIVGTLAFPITIYIATLRYHLFGVEAVLGRTLVYVPLMGICGGLYAAGMVVSQRVFIAVTGNTSDMAIIVATLLMAASFTPARKALETGVERLLAPRRDGGHGDEPESPEPGAEHARLRQTATELAARLTDIEHQLAALEQPRQRDAAREAGEPGVGRTTNRDPGEPGVGLVAGEPRPGRA
jgi:hypothetical protein